MKRIILTIDSSQLGNPDLDIRYELPDLLEKRSGGNISADGYDYVGEHGMMMKLFLKCSQLEPALTCIRDVIETETLLGNELSGKVVVELEDDPGRLVYPEGNGGE